MPPKTCIVNKTVFKAGKYLFNMWNSECVLVIPSPKWFVSAMGTVKGTELHLSVYTEQTRGIIDGPNGPHLP